MHIYDMFSLWEPNLNKTTFLKEMCPWSCIDIYFYKAYHARVLFITNDYISPFIQLMITLVLLEFQVEYKTPTVIYARLKHIQTWPR